MTTSIHRRQFISQTALGGAGLAALTAIASAKEAPSNRVVVGVMGLSRGRALAAAFAQQPGVEVRYLCDVDSDRVAEAVAEMEKSKVPAGRGIKDFRVILDDKEVDALICAAPIHWHAAATVLACAAGKHVYVEKPCSHTPREGELMIEAARTNRRAVQVGTQRRSGPAIREAMALLHDGVIGNVHTARGHYANTRRTIGRGKPVDVPARLDYDLWQGPAPRMPYLDNRVHYNWNFLWHWGNGELGNNGVHTLDLCRWGLNVDFPTRITSSGGRYWFDDDQETPDSQIIGLEFDGGKFITWQGHSCNLHDSAEFVTFYGDQGALKIEDWGDYTVFDKADEPIKSNKGVMGDIEHIVDFLQAIRDDQPERLNAEIAEGHKSALLCHLGNIAHRTGRTINCTASDGHIIGDEEAIALWDRSYEPGWEPRV